MQKIATVLIFGYMLLMTGESTQASPMATSASMEIAPTNPDVGAPVFPYDITERPYEIVGEVTAKVRKATIFSKEASQQKIYRELWERAKKMGADAVVNARYGDSHVTAFNWGSTTASGTAIRFTPLKASNGKRDD